MSKKVTKKSLIDGLLKYISEKYCDDEIIGDFFSKYDRLSISHKKASNRSGKGSGYKHSLKGKYLITEAVRDFIEPLVDAEYFKCRYYCSAISDSGILYDAMQQLNTEQFKNIENDYNQNCLDNCPDK